MMRDQLRHLMATLSVFLVSIGLMGATPKKSEAADPVVTVVCATGVTGAGLLGCYIAWWWITTPPGAGCTPGPCGKMTDAFGSVLCAPGVPGTACNTGVLTNCNCASVNTKGCDCVRN